VDTTAPHGPGLAQQYIIGQAALHSGTSLSRPREKRTLEDEESRGAAERCLARSAAERWRPPTPLEPMQWAALEEEEEAGSDRAS
jgi:hypothetical protein